MDNFLRAVLPLVARAKMLNSIEPNGGTAWLATGSGMEHRRALDMMKSAVSAGAASGGWVSGMVGDTDAAVTVFFNSLRTRSVFFRLLADGAINRAPWQTRLGMATAGASGFIVGQGKPTPLSKLALSNPELTPQKAAALMVATAELIRSTQPESTALFDAELRGAVSDAVDAEFFSAIGGDSPISSSNGPSAAAARQDLLDMLLAVNTKNARLYWILADDTAKMASALGTTEGAPVFPDMSPTGGEMLGLPALVSSVLPSGSITLLDASGLIGNAGNIELSASRNASIEMDTSPTGNSDSPLETTLVSMFQTNSVALMATVDFAVEKMRSSAAATITGITWGGEGSP